MPFESVQTIRFIGEPNTDDEFALTTDRNTYFGGISSDGGDPAKWHLRLLLSRCPKQVAQAAYELLDELGEAHPLVNFDFNAITAWIYNREQLVVGAPSFVVTLRYGTWEETREVSVEERIKRIVPFKMGVPAI